MSAILSGSMKAFPAEAILRFLMSSGATGSLRLSSVPVELFLRSGSVVFARTARENVTASATPPAGPSATDVKRAVLEILEADGGTFEFDDAPSAPQDSVAIDLDLAALSTEAAARRERRQQARSMFASPDAVAYVVSTPDAAQIRLDQEEFKLLFRIGSAKLVLDVVRESGGDAARIYDQLHHLVEENLIEVRIPAAQPEAPAAEEAAPSTGIGCLTLEDEARTSYPLFDDVYTIGRDPSNTIRIKDGSISGSHARIVRAPGGYAIEDVGSRNGTFVNGRQVQRELLHNNDNIRLGKIFLTFNIADSDMEQTIERRVDTDLG